MSHNINPEKKSGKNQLRRQALESGKTLSRKAKARLESASIASSPFASPGGSRAGSRAPSRNNSAPPSRVPSNAGSTDGDEADEDNLEVSSNSFSVDSTDAAFTQLFSSLEDRDFWKGDSQHRVALIRRYANSIANSYSILDDKHDKLRDMMPILLRCIKEGSAGTCTEYALRALAITVIVIGDYDGELFMELKDPLQICMYDTASAVGQKAAVQAMSAITFFGGADYQEVSSFMELLLDIVESDGEQVEALDEASVVASAIQEWAFLSTLVTVDVNQFSRALEAFGAQLESNAPSVIQAGAEAIALIYESAYTLKTSGDEVEVSAQDEEEDSKVHPTYRKANWAHTHTFRNDNDYAIREQLKILTKTPLRHVKKDLRKDLKNRFRDVLHALDYPWRGPHYSTAMEAESGDHYGHRMYMGGMVIDRWWKLIRYVTVRRTLQHGVEAQAADNPAVQDALRNCLEAPSRFRNVSHTGHALLDREYEEHVPQQPNYDDLPSDEDEDEESPEEDEDLELHGRMGKLRVR
ncbi:hypothetical protein BT63DRAFT_61787 [Microthyrium microscopicum]|uniref:Interferon-related developmental regulator N-terminal domain-containing protein n=1 Tax=Microthyrium microscopicum TaxID=703497 RepID=A0A6A6U226_9PEZI|nr:hypothetical protein BT63DRAFT_61787 [Microthyrium microscopicum]